MFCIYIHIKYSEFNDTSGGDAWHAFDSCTICIICIHVILCTCTHIPYWSCWCDISQITEIRNHVYICICDTAQKNFFTYHIFHLHVITYFYETRMIYIRSRIHMFVYAIPDQKIHLHIRYFICMLSHFFMKYECAVALRQPYICMAVSRLLRIQESSTCFICIKIHYTW